MVCTCVCVLCVCVSMWDRVGGCSCFVSHQSSLADCVQVSAICPGALSLCLNHLLFLLAHTWTHTHTPSSPHILSLCPQVIMKLGSKGFKFWVVVQNVFYLEAKKQIEVWLTLRHRRFKSKKQNSLCFWFFYNSYNKLYDNLNRHDTAFTKANLNIPVLLNALSYF